MSKTIGVIKWYDRKHEYGFVNAEVCDRDIYFKAKNIGDLDPRLLQPGVDVEFSLTRVKQGFEARNIKVLTPRSEIDVPAKDRLKLEDLFNKKVVNIEVDTEMMGEDEEDGIFVRALVFEGNIRVPLFSDDDGVFLSFEPDEDDEEES